MGDFNLGVLALGVLGLGAVAVLIFRRAFLRPARPPHPWGLQTEGFTDQSDAMARADPILRAPRILFYLGALTVTQSSLRPAFGLTVSEFFFLAAFAATIFAVLAGRPIARVPGALVVGVGIFAFGGLISTPGAASPVGSLAQVLQGVYVMLLWAWMGATVLRTRPQILIALTFWSMSAAFDGFAAILQVMGIHALSGPLEANRATGLTSHPNDLGGACAVALVPALMLATSRFPGRAVTASAAMRPVYWVTVGLVAAGLVLSASVAAMVAGLIAILAWLVAPAVRAPARLSVVVVLAFTLIALTLAAGQVASPTERLREVTNTSGLQSTSGSGATRIRTAKRALPRIAADPVVGTGLDNAGGVVNVINEGHSVPYQVHGAPVAVWYQAGILGLVGFLIVVVTLARIAWRSLSAGDQSDVVIGLAIFAAFIAFIIYALTSPFVFQQYGWFSGVMLVAWRFRRDAVAIYVPGRESPVMPGPLPEMAAH